MGTVKGILDSGLIFYYRKLRIDLEGGHGLNVRREDTTIQKRRTKMGAKSEWRRGEVEEKWRKENGWRAGSSGSEPLQGREGNECESGSTTNNRRNLAGPRTGQGRTRRLQTAPHDEPKLPGGEEDPQSNTVTTLLVPFSAGSKLQKAVQHAEDQFVALTGCQRIRVVEQGGDKLSNLVCRNDPWASRRVCPDSNCATCKSRTWLKDQKVAAKKTGKTLPKVLLSSASSQCREGGGNICSPMPRLCFGRQEVLLPGGDVKIHKAAPGPTPEGLGAGDCKLPTCGPCSPGTWGQKAQHSICYQEHGAQATL